MHIGFHVKYRYCCQIFMKLEFSPQIFLIISKCQISWKSFIWETRCFTLTEGRTDIMKLIVIFRDFPNASTNCFPVRYNILIPRDLANTELSQHHNVANIGKSGMRKYEVSQWRNRLSMAKLTNLIAFYSRRNTNFGISNVSVFRRHTTEVGLTERLPFRE